MLVRRKWISSQPRTATGLVGKQDVKRASSRFSLCSLVLAAGLGMALLSGPARALGLGDIEVHSALNQPLDAEISLLSVKADDASRINVKLADDIAYLTSGIERTSSLSQLTFSVAMGTGGKTVVRVASQDPIKEPFLDFIIEINWPSGRLLREYTILLDPPIFAGESSASIAVPGTGRSGAAATKAPAASFVPPRATAVTSSATAQGSTSSATSAKHAPASAQPSGAGEYKVKPSESLRSIADSINPNSNDYSSEQVMMAMYRLNPDAFFDDNINNLKKGYVLRTPDEAQVAELSRSDAGKQARDHYDRWLQRRKVKNAAAPDKVGSDTGLAAMRDTTKAAVRKQGKPDAQLRLLSPEEGESLGAGGQGKTKGAGTAADKEVVELENRELKDQISSLKEQLATMERLITLKTDAMVELQKKVGTDAKSASPVAGTVPADSTSPTTEVVPAAQPQAAVTAAPTQAPVAPQPAKKVREQKAQPEPAVETGWADALMEPRLLAMLVGVVLLLGAGVWMFLRRRREAAESEFDMSYDQESAAPVEIKLPAGGRRAASEQAVAETQVDTGLEFGNVGGYQSAGLETFETDESEIDPIAEADVYLAYRRFQQAEDLIRDALKREPQREELHLKMLEIYFGSGNKEGFEAQAEALYAILGGAETDTWHKVVSMGQELCPDHPLFGGGEPTHVAPAESNSVPRQTGAVVTAADQYAPLWQQDSNANEAMDEIPAESHQFAEFANRAGTSAHAASEDHVMNFEPAATQAGTLMKPGRDERLPDPSSSVRENAMEFDLSGFAFDKSANNGGHDDAASHDSVAEFDFSKMEHGNFDTDLAASGDTMGQRARSEHELDTALQGLGHNIGEGEEVFTGLDDVGLGDDSDDLFSGADMISTKLDLARAYIDMDDREGARGILSEVIEEGNNSQKQEATELMKKLG